MEALFNPASWPPGIDFLAFAAVTGWLVWRTARAFFEKKEKRWPAEAVQSIADAKDLRQVNEVLKEKLRAAHAELEAKQAKIESLRAEKQA